MTYIIKSKLSPLYASNHKKPPAEAEGFELGSD